MGSAEGANGPDGSSSDRASAGRDAADRAREASEAASKTEAARNAEKVKTDAVSAASEAGNFEAAQDQLSREAEKARQGYDTAVRDALAKKSAPSAQTPTAGLATARASLTTMGAASVATGAATATVATQAALHVAAPAAQVAGPTSQTSLQTVAANIHAPPTTSPLFGVNPGSLLRSAVSVARFAKSATSITPAGLAARVAELAVKDLLALENAKRQTEVQVGKALSLDAQTDSSRMAVREFVGGIEHGTLRARVAGQAAAIIEMQHPGITERSFSKDAEKLQRDAFIKGAIDKVDQSGWSSWGESYPEASVQDREIFGRVEGLTKELGVGAAGAIVSASESGEAVGEPSKADGADGELPTGQSEPEPPEDELEKPPRDPGLPDNGVDYDAIDTSKGKPNQTTKPRTEFEKKVIDRVKKNPKQGDNMRKFKREDPRFRNEDGFQKKVAFEISPSGERVEVHYQYSSRTGKAYDVKIVNINN